MEAMTLAVLAAIAGAGFWYYRRQRKVRPVIPSVRQPTVESLRPGDVVGLGVDQYLVVDAVLQCQENLGSRTTTWRWNFLHGGRMLEAAPDGNVLYHRTAVLHQGA